MKASANGSSATGARLRVQTDYQRSLPVSALQYFPTPPWATRALVEECGLDVRGQVVWEPNCGEGDIARTLEEYGPSEIYASDVYPYGYGNVADFHDCDPPCDDIDIIVMNPPFKEAAAFVQRALTIARKKVAVLIRVQWLEPLSDRPDLLLSGALREIWSFGLCGRLSMAPGTVDPKASLSTHYVWLIFDSDPSTWVGPASWQWIPDCRKRLERHGDYQRARPFSGIERAPLDALSDQLEPGLRPIGDIAREVVEKVRER